MNADREDAPPDLSLGGTEWMSPGTLRRAVEDPPTGQIRVPEPDPIGDGRDWFAAIAFTMVAAFIVLACFVLSF